MAPYRPDIVLLQESPGRVELQSLADALFGAKAAVVTGPDASMIVRGRVVLADLTPEQRSYFVQARVVLESGLEVEVFSLRLVPAVFRLDLWPPECWREQRGTAAGDGRRSVPSRIGSGCSPATSR